MPGVRQCGWVLLWDIRSSNLRLQLLVGHPCSSWVCNSQSCGCQCYAVQTCQAARFTPLSLGRTAQGPTKASLQEYATHIVPICTKFFCGFRFVLLAMQSWHVCMPVHFGAVTAMWYRCGADFLLSSQPPVNIGTPSAQALKVASSVLQDAAI
jgi:hypothetical protein